MYSYQDSRTGRVAPLVVRTDGRVVQLPATAVADWPISYIMTFVGERRALRTALLGLASDIFGVRR